MKSHPQSEELLVTNDYWKGVRFPQECCPWEAASPQVEGPIPMHILSALSGFNVLEIKEHMKFGGNSWGVRKNLEKK